MATENKRELSTAEGEALLKTFHARFHKNMHRHTGIVWANVQAKLELPSSATKLWSLQAMESTGGEPDVVGYDPEKDAFVFYDCAAESPKGRRSLCFDREAHEARKEFKPENTVIDMAAEMGIELLTEAQYRALQELGDFDTKTSSWIQTPAAIRKLDGALFCDRRYNHVFVYHNGASSYYAARGFRGALWV